MTLLDWDKDAQTMTDEELAARIALIEGFDAWPAFKREFGWTGYGALIWTLKGEQEARKTQHPHRDAQIRLQRSRQR